MRFSRSVERPTSSGFAAGTRAGHERQSHERNDHQHRKYASFYLLAGVPASAHIGVRRNEHNSTRSPPSSKTSITVPHHPRSVQSRVEGNDHSPADTIHQRRP